MSSSHENDRHNSIRKFGEKTLPINSRGTVLFDSSSIQRRAERRAEKISMDA